jgi:hypothetical protein
MAIDIIRGSVSHITRSGGSGNVLTCMVRGRPVEIDMPSPPILEDGDEVVVAGTSKFGTLKAHAFRNLKNGTSGHWPYDLGPILAAVGTMFGAFCFSIVLPPLFVLFLAYCAGALPKLVPLLVEKRRVLQSYSSVMSNGHALAM